MTHYIKMTSIDDQIPQFPQIEIEEVSTDDQIPLLSQTKKDEIEEGREVDHVIEIKETNDPLGSRTKKFVNQIFEMFEDLDNSSIKSSTIFRVNVWLSESNPDAYRPKMVSIGSYHKRHPLVGPMEKYKLLYLRRFLKRKGGLHMENCINQLENLKEKALKCYDNIEDLDIREFCHMLLLDGCFVVEFIRERCEMCPEGEEEIININPGYILQDLLLLENQLPFFVLNHLHHITKQDDELPLTILANNSFTFLVDLPKMTVASFRKTECNTVNIKHLLHLVHIFSCHGNPMKLNSKVSITRNKVMPNAIELSEAGVRFIKVGDMSSLFDIKFENGLMTIPCFQVEDGTETILRNLIAYEQQSFDVQQKYFSDFATFMDYLIDSEKDVNLLRQNGIIEHWLGDDKQVASLFNKIAYGVGAYSNFYYNEECIKAVEHCKKPWNRMKANLRHNYFNSPWAGASTVAAIILLLLTATQTVLSFISVIR